MNRLYHQYKKQVEFFLVYIEEAHSSDGWQMAINEKENVIFKNPKHYDERTDVAATCSTNLGIEFPALVDTIDNSTEISYTAWPDRIYVIDRDGLVAFKSDAGPFGFKPEYLFQILPRLLPPEAITVNR